MFKDCKVCGFVWPDIDDFLTDPTIEIIGYMPLFDDLNNGLLLFNHACRGTFSCYVGVFRHLYNGPVFMERKTGTTDCPGYCLHKSNLSPCPAECHCAYVRDTIQIIRQWPKRGLDDTARTG